MHSRFIPLPLRMLAPLSASRVGLALRAPGALRAERAARRAIRSRHSNPNAVIEKQQREFMGMLGEGDAQKAARRQEVEEQTIVEQPSVA